MPPAEEELGGDDVEMQGVVPVPTSTSRELTTYRRPSRLTTGDSMVFHPRTERVRRAETPRLLLNDGSANYESAIVESTNNDQNRGTDSDSDSGDQFWPPSPKRPRIDEDGLLAEAVLVYAALGYQQAIDGDDAADYIAEQPTQRVRVYLENSTDITLIEAKEKLLKEYERLEKKETSERALKVTLDGGRGKFVERGRNNDRKGNNTKTNGGFRGKCFSCDQVEHMKRGCPNKVDGSDDGAVFAASDLSPVNESEDSVITNAMADTALAVGKDRSPSWPIPGRPL
ncbi:putative polyprotein [Plasmopara halstedii]|uniref:Putative polyprotein n=1 Tax=Plasmopara halstedii TaxID=4781 RepID=A0A0P1AJP6_PLAHL|nr:putative polyprotein [Plasmopara halstedii]CEG40742.1 putative polyprotein [Plasmopara halstedii]|eukprot:XP_024577111.1 putative polyprotein [Plasmopara halstedii]